MAYVMNEWKWCYKMINSDKAWNALPVILSIKELDLLANTFFIYAYTCRNVL